MEEELALPSLLHSLDKQTKRQLLAFKRTHNEREWEEEILRRQDMLAKQIDMERLQRMKTGQSAASASATTPAKGKVCELLVSKYVSSLWFLSHFAAA